MRLRICICVNLYLYLCLYLSVSLSLSMCVSDAVFVLQLLYVGRWTAMPTQLRDELQLQSGTPDVPTAQGEDVMRLQEEVKQLQAQLKAAAAATAVADGPAGAAGAKSDADAPFITSRRCVMTGAWGDYCVYDNLCFKSTKEIVWVTDKFVRGVRRSAGWLAGRVRALPPHR